MILGNLRNSASDYGLSSRISKALNYLANSDLSCLRPGRYEMDDPGMYFLVQEFTTERTEQPKWEEHRLYVDIHYLISGEELMGCADLKNMSLVKEYDSPRDVALYAGEGNTFSVEENEFAVFLPGEAHVSRLAVKEPTPVKKIVVKVLSES